MSYFECNLPDSCPHICAGKRSYFEDTVKVIKARMAKLDDALAKSGMDGAAFAKTAKILFDNSFDLFERMDSVELAMWVQNSYDGKPVEHRFEWPNAEVVVDCAFVQTKEWEALRRCRFRRFEFHPWREPVQNGAGDLPRQGGHP